MPFVEAVKEVKDKWWKKISKHFIRLPYTWYEDRKISIINFMSLYAFKYGEDIWRTLVDRMVKRHFRENWGDDTPRYSVEKSKRELLEIEWRYRLEKAVGFKKEYIDGPDPPKELIINFVRFYVENAEKRLETIKKLCGGDLEEWRYMWGMGNAQKYREAEYRSLKKLEEILDEADERIAELEGLSGREFRDLFVQAMREWIDDKSDFWRWLESEGLTPKPKIVKYHVYPIGLYPTNLDPYSAVKLREDRSEIIRFIDNEYGTVVPEVPESLSFSIDDLLETSGATIPPYLSETPEDYFSYQSEHKDDILRELKECILNMPDEEYNEIVDITLEAFNIFVDPGPQYMDLEDYLDDTCRWPCTLFLAEVIKRHWREMEHIKELIEMKEKAYRERSLTELHRRYYELIYTLSRTQSHIEKMLRYGGLSDEEWRDWKRMRDMVILSQNILESGVGYYYRGEESMRKIGWDPEKVEEAMRFVIDRIEGRIRDEFERERYKGLKEAIEFAKQFELMPPSELLKRKYE